LREASLTGFGAGPEFNYMRVLPYWQIVIARLGKTLILPRRVLPHRQMIFCRGLYGEYPGKYFQPYVAGFKSKRV
jgi:hypothetical protein